MHESSQKRILKDHRNRLIIWTAGIPIASVMAFGQFKIAVHVIFFGATHYPSGYMIAMFLPMVPVLALLSWGFLAAMKRRLSPDRRRHSPRNWIAIRVAILTSTAALSAGAIDLWSQSSSGPAENRALLETATMSALMAIFMAIVSYFSLRAIRYYLIHAIADENRTSTIKAHNRILRMGRRRRLSQSVRLMRNSRIRESTIIVIGSVMTFWLTEYVANVVLQGNPNYHSGDMIGMILPMALIMTIISIASLRVMNRSLSYLLEGIEKIASGKFSIRLDIARAGAYREIFIDFNTMCQELESVQTLRDDFINHFSHEFKTPITSINGFVKLLLEEQVSDEERRRYLKIIAAESERLSDMSGKALMMTRLDSQQYLSDKAPFPLDEQIKQCAILLSPTWSQKGIDLTAELEPATWTGNADLLMQVWINLIANAIQFTPSGGKITIYLRREENTFRIDIADTGKGMTAEEIAHAFEKYYQGEAERSTRGLGLGLAIAKTIVTLSGGNISATSKPGRGSVFTVRLPA